MKRGYYLIAHHHAVNVLTSNITQCNHQFKLQFRVSCHYWLHQVQPTGKWKLLTYYHRPLTVCLSEE